MAASASLQASASVEIMPLPEGVRSCSPAQGRIDIGNNASPLGAQEISLGFAEQVMVNEDCTATAHVYKDGADTPFASATVANAYVDVMSYRVGAIKFDRSCKAPGTYHVVLPAGLWLMGDNATLSPEVELNYEIIVPQTISPLPGTVESLSEFQLSCPGYDAVTYDSAKKLDFYKVGSDESFHISVLPLDATTMTLILSQEVTATGTYSLMIPANAFKAVVKDEDGTVIEEVGNTEVIYTWTLSTIPAPGITPAPGKISGFKSFTLTSPEGYDLFFIDDRTRNNIYAVEADGSLSADPVYYALGQRTEEGDIFLNVIDPATYQPTETELVPAPGMYCLKLASNFMSGIWDGNFESTPSYNYYYEIEIASGLDIVPDAAGEMKVYTIYGQHAATITDLSQLKALPAGLYIVNGKKYLRR